MVQWSFLNLSITGVKAKSLACQVQHEKYTARIEMKENKYFSFVWYSTATTLMRTSSTWLRLVKVHLAHDSYKLQRATSSIVEVDGQAGSKGRLDLT